MNPSGRGWITKLLKLIKANHKEGFDSLEILYLKLRDVGFLYGSNVATLDYVKIVLITQKKSAARLIY